MSKTKAQGLSLRTIIIVVLLLVVLIVLITIFTRQTGSGVDALNDCENKGYECLTPEECQQGQGTLMPFLECKTDNTKHQCCNLIGANEK